MGLKDQAKGLTVALRLDSHHAIERFGVIFGSLAVAFVVLFSSALASSIGNQAEHLGSTALYTPSFTTSKTQLAGEVMGVYVSTDKKRTMLMMHFADGSSISANAEKYKAFLTGASQDLSGQTIRNSGLSSRIVLFGSTGYMAFVLDGEEPFAQQILNLTLRANSELVYRPEQSRKVRADLQGQASFSEFDQWRVYFNPGASKATVLDALDTTDFDAAAVYAKLVVAPAEEKARGVLDDQLAQMQVDLARIAEFESDAQRVTVDGVSLQVPETPVPIKGDRIEGKPAVGEKKSTLKLETNWVSPRGYDFDWRSGSVEKGYLEQVIPAGESYATWLAERSTKTRGEEGNAVNFAQEDWPLSNGRLLNKDYKSSDLAMKPLFDIRNGLSQAYQSYYQHKVKYQTDAYAPLVELELDLRAVREGTTSNTAKDSLYVY